MRTQWATIAIAIAASIGFAPGQWLNDPLPGTPRTREGKPNLSAPAPRAANGKPDLSGTWQVESTPPDEMVRLFGDAVGFQALGDDPRTFSKYMVNLLADFKPEDAPLLPQAADAFRKRRASDRTDRPMTHCLPAGVPAADLLPRPFKIIQSPRVIAMLFEGDGSFRQVFTDGRKHPIDAQPAWLGYSVGRWDADTLVVETRGFNDKSWLDIMGHSHSEALRVQERFHRRDFGHMEVQATVDDPQTFTRPFTIKFEEHIIADSEILEYFCSENEKDRAHFPKK